LGTDGTEVPEMSVIDCVIRFDFESLEIGNTLGRDGEDLRYEVEE